RRVPGLDPRPRRTPRGDAGAGEPDAPAGASGSADVADEVVALALQLGDAALDHVADADDADERTPGVDHGDVADAPFGHRAGEVLHRGLAGAGHDVDGHDLRHLPVEERTTVVGQAADDVALRHDPGDRLVGGDDR